MSRRKTPSAPAAPGNGDAGDVPPFAGSGEGEGGSLPSLEQVDLTHLTREALLRLVQQYKTRQRLGLYWERDEIEHERLLRETVPLVRRIPSEGGAQLEAGEGAFPNLVIEGDNFDTLRLLRRTHLGKVRVVCVDPPYNRGKKDLVYNDRYVRTTDRFRQSMWLEHLFQRFELARDLLTEDGVLLVFINDENRSKLELLLDQIFPGLRVGSFVWRTRSGSNDVTGARLSIDHEHVLVFAKRAFAFAGVEKDFADYRYDDGDGRGPWASKDLSAAVAFDDPRAGNGYYPLFNPETQVWYPCNPNRVWAYVTREQAAPDQVFKSYSMDDLIEQGRIKWPDSDERIEVWNTLDELLAAIDSGDVPKAKGAPLLRRDLPGIEGWVGRRVGFGRPRMKRFLREVTENRQPVSSWIRPETFSERMADDDEVELVSAYGEEGGQALQQLFGKKVFSYPKPPSLLITLLRQATNPGDIVLDFYAGSGTTAHAVMALNAEDRESGRSGPPRRFIMASSTEATGEEPDKNVCRDACAARLVRLSAGAPGRQAMPDAFTYLRVETIPAQDVEYEVAEEHVWNSITLSHAQVIAPFRPSELNVLELVGGPPVIYCPTIDEGVMRELASLAAMEMIVYSPRPRIVREHLEAVGKRVDARSAIEAVSAGGAL